MRAHTYILGEKSQGGWRKLERQNQHTAHQHTSTSTQPTHRQCTNLSPHFPLFPPPSLHFPALKQVETHETTLLLLCCDDFFKDNAFCFSPEQVLLPYEICGTVWTHTVSHIHLNPWTQTHTYTHSLSFKQGDVFSTWYTPTSHSQFLPVVTSRAFYFASPALHSTKC